MPFIPSAQGEPPIIDVLESNNSRTVVHITIPGMYVEDTLIQGTTYHILSIPEHKLMCDIGAPKLPAIRELVAIPPISDVDIIINIGAPLVFNGYMVYPSQEPKPYGEPPGPFIIDTIIYSTNAFYPGKMAEKSDPAILKDMRVINTSCYPIIFNPVTQELNVYYDFTVELNYYGTSNINPLPHGYPSVVALMYEAMYKDLIINYDWLGISSERSSSWDYLVITATEYFNDLQDFVFWKHKKGCMIKVAKPVDIVFPRTYFIQDDTLAIKNYILNTFDVGATDKQFYVLFIGDENAIPMCRYPTIFANVQNWSDHFYACLIGDDDYADIAIGRLSVANSSDVTTIINKIFAYERDPAQDWAIGRALMVSHHEDGPTWFHDTTEKIIDDFLVPNGFEYYDADGGAGIWSNQDLKECIENSDPDYPGVGIINYFGHGDTAKWDEWNVSESFTTAEVHGLSNTNLYPIVYNCCCLNGAIQAEQKAMVEAWIREPDRGGVGALGASVMAWAAQYWGPNHIPVDLFRATFALGIYKVGWAINYAKDRLVEEEPAARGFALHNARTYNWFGDPELSIWTCAAPCSTMNVSHPMNISIGQQNFTVTVINPQTGPVQYALVCLYKDENPELWQTQLTRANGQASFTINPRYGGVLYVTVTKHNYAPYERECTVWPGGGGGPQSEESSPGIPKNYALNQNSPNPFYRTTFITYQIPARGDKQFISIKIYDVDGRLIKILVNQQQEAGYYVKTWDGRDENNKKVSNGIYFLRFEATDYSETRKLLLIR